MNKLERSVGIVLSVMPFLSGCSTASYLLQAGRGQLAIMNRMQKIEEVVANEKTPPRIRRLLLEISKIKTFSEEQSLKKTSNYRNYVQLDRPAAVWVVSAAEPLQMRPKEWHFPIIGGVPYLGYFDLTRAKEFSQELKNQGLDTYLRGAGAYSTLGWFPDPILSSMIPEGNEAMGSLVNVVIHESVHAAYYLKGQTPFNESLASFVADRLTPVYLEKSAEVTLEERQAYAQATVEGKKRTARLYQAFTDLDKLYQSSIPDVEKLERKASYLKALQEELKLQREPNNAMLVQFKAYNTGSELFESLFQFCESSWPAFWRGLRQVSEKDFPTEQLDQATQWEKILSRIRSQPCR